MAVTPSTRDIGVTAGCHPAISTIVICKPSRERLAPPGSEPDGGPQDQGEEQRQRGVGGAGNGACVANRLGHDDDADDHDRQSETGRLHVAPPRGLVSPAREHGDDRDDARHERQLCQDVGEKPGAPDEPVRLVQEVRDHGGRDKRGNEGRGQHGAGYEDSGPIQRVEARRRVAELAYGDRGDEGFEAIGCEESQDEREWPADSELGDQMGRQRRQQIDPPQSCRSEQERGRQDRVGGPEDRQGRRGNSENEPDVRPDVVCDRHEHGRRGDAPDRRVPGADARRGPNQCFCSIHRCSGPGDGLTRPCQAHRARSLLLMVGACQPSGRREKESGPFVNCAAAAIEGAVWPPRPSLQRRASDR